MSQTPSPQPAKPQKSFLWLKIIGAGLVGFIGFGFFLDSQEGQTYDKALKAYQSADCETASKEFAKVLEGKSQSDTSDRVISSRAKKAECDEYQKAVVQQKTGKPAPAFTIYANFVTTYPKSPLIKEVAKSTPALLTKADFKTLAQPTSCKQLKGITDSKILPEPEKNLPLLYQNCGQLFESKKQYSQAVVIYEDFLTKFPKHPLLPSIKASFAKSLVAEAKQTGAGNIPRPQSAGFSGSGSTVVEIRNESPEKMRIVFSGPQPRFEELEGCTNCQKFVNVGPRSCPNKGPVGRYTLTPGNYEVVVKSIGQGRVRPFTGQWSLSSGTEYKNCFFIVQRPG
ncbi:MAG TPA: tetratricopeptide repeat protein [Nostocaceae cyanobacterium]|nr:tetratricopeptide repeat protein [Nostocaceae cyanobacterium]